MRKTDPSYQRKLHQATDSLMERFIRWNDIQKELMDKGYPHDYYTKEVLDRERAAYGAIAERFVLEDVDYRGWEWFESPWAKTDEETGCIVQVIYFVRCGPKAKEWGGMLPFCVTYNGRFWYAVPLVEIAEEGFDVFEVNTIQDALDMLQETETKD